jgi:ribosomal protein L11 methyltransferase
MARRPGRFLLVRLVLPPAGEEPAVAACWEAGCLGVETTSSAVDRHHPRLTLKAYFPGRIAPLRLRRRLAASLRACGVPHRGPLRLTTLTDRRWVEDWRRSLRPMRIGRRLLVVPEGCRLPPPRGRLPIRMRFGQAFGTGEHATTRLALRLLERSLRQGDRVLDLGTGTGILAMAALRLGAAGALAVDSDPVALRVAAHNVAKNGLRGRVRLRQGDAASARGRHDLILINIGAEVIGALLPGLPDRLAPGGRAILTGLLLENETPLRRAAAGAGLRTTVALHAPPWAALLVQQAAPSPSVY